MVAVDVTTVIAASLSLYGLFWAAALWMRIRTGNPFPLILLLATFASVGPIMARKLSVMSADQAELSGVVVLSFAVVVAWSSRHHLSIHPDSVDLAILVLYATSIVAWGITSGDMSAKSVARWILELVPVSLALFVRHSASIRQARQALALATFAIIAPSLLLGFSRVPLAYSGALGPDEGTVSDRLSGLLGHSNSLGTIGAMAAGLSLGARPSLLGSLGFASGAVATFMSGQRSAYIPVMILASVFFARLVAGAFAPRLRPPLYVLMSASALTLLPGAIILLNATVADRMASVEGRETIWSFVARNLGLFLPIGLGPRGLYDITSTVFLGEQFFHAHDQFLTWITIAGLPAIVTIVLLLLKWVRSLTLGGPFEWFVSISLAPPLLLESPLHVGFTSQTVATACLTWTGLLLVLRTNVTQSREESGG